jgi:hypothetical protein
MSLSPTCTVTLGNLKYDSHVSGLVASLTLLPGVNQARLTLPDGVPVEAAPGDPAIIELDGGEGAQTVLTGKIQGLFHHLLGVEVWVADGGAALAGFHSAATYEKQSAKDIVTALASEAGVDVGALDMDLRLSAYAASQRRSAAEHIAYLADLDGRLAFFDGDGALQVRPRPSGPADLALLFGREIIACQARQLPAPSPRRMLLGSGPAGAADAPDALRPSLEPLPSDAPNPGKEAIWRAAAILRTPQAANAASQAADQAMAAHTSQIACRAFLLPQLRPGLVVEIQELPGAVGENGPWLLRRVTFRLNPRDGATTFFEGETAGASNLLGSLLATVGSLL